MTNDSCVTSATCLALTIEVGWQSWENWKFWPRHKTRVQSLSLQPKHLNKLGLLTDPVTHLCHSLVCGSWSAFTQFGRILVDELFVKVISKGGNIWNIGYALCHLLSIFSMSTCSVSALMASIQLVCLKKCHIDIDRKLDHHNLLKLSMNWLNGQNNV